MRRSFNGWQLKAARVFAAALGLCLASAISCATDSDPLLPAETSGTSALAGGRLVARIVHVSDSHAVDSESPARFAGAQVVVPSAWRAWESASTQLFDGVIRQVNRIHASGAHVDFLLHTGDACDNSQTNELGWFLAVMDGQVVTPLSGPDDRLADTLPPTDLDPYAPFQAQGLYRQGVHGNAPSIPWYAVLGNHDHYSIGVFPIVTTHDGSRVAPLPLSGRPGILLPTVLDPVGAWTHGPVTPAHPGPPPLLDLPAPVMPVEERRFFGRDEYMGEMFATATRPVGHGFSDPSGTGWYSVAPAPGIRLITLNTTDRPHEMPGYPSSEGAMSREQFDWLAGELDASQQRGELVIVASHHPSETFQVLGGSEMAPEDLRNLLSAHPCVILHLAGHTHRNRVTQRTGYLEIETCSTIDLPQEARVIEIWTDDTNTTTTIAYHMFSGLDNALSALGDDPLLGLREAAHALAQQGRGNPALQKGIEGGSNPEGSPSDRQGVIRLR